MDLNKQKDEINFFLKTKKYKFSILGSNPNHDWVVMISLAVILVIISSLFFIRENRNISKVMNQEVEIVSSKKYLNLDEVKSFLATFEARKNNREVIDQDL